MTAEICRHRGHDWHRTDDGTQFVRHSQNPKGLVGVVCCWCEKHAEIEGHSKATDKPAQSSYLADQEHGPFKPYSLQRLVDNAGVTQAKDYPV